MVLEDEFKFGRFKVWFSDGSVSLRFTIFRFVPTLVKNDLVLRFALFGVPWSSFNQKIMRENLLKEIVRIIGQLSHGP